MNKIPGKKNNRLETKTKEVLDFSEFMKTMFVKMTYINGIKVIGMALIVLMLGCKNDEATNLKRPTVTSTTPSDKEDSISTSSVIKVNFSEPMDSASVNASTFTLKQGSISAEGRVTYAGSTASFSPKSRLEFNKVYTGTIASGAKSKTGIALGSNYTFSFTTEVPETVSPTIREVSPSANATDVPRNQVISITFSEEMDSTTISSSNFSLKQGTSIIPGNIGYSGITATFTPLDPLQAGTSYTAKISMGAKDKAGNTLAGIKEWSFNTGGNMVGLAAVDLGSAANYVILAKTAINNNPTSTITGDLGLSPAATTYITGLSLTDFTGYATSSQVTGKVFAADMADPTPINLTTAVDNMLTAYTDAAGRPSPDFSELNTGNIGGKTLVPGLYKWTNSVTVPSNMTLNGAANDIWIFQIAGNLSLSSGVKITLSGGAQAKNIFWQVAGEVTIGTAAHFEGILMSMKGITLQTGATLHGRTLAQTAVVLDGNTIVKP